MYYQETIDNSDIILEQEDKLQELEESFYVSNEGTSKTRMMVNSYLVDLFRNALGCPEQLDRIHGIMSKLSEHPESTLRLVLMKNLPRLALLCCGGDRLNYVNTQLWPLLLSCLPDKNDEVRKASEISLLVLIRGKLLEQETLEEQVCPFVVEISKLDGYASTVAPALMSRKLLDFIQEEGRNLGEVEKEEKGRRFGGHKVIVKCFAIHITATLMTFKFADYHSDTESFCIIGDPPVKSALMGKMAPLIGKETTEKHFLDRFVHLCSNEQPIIREMCAKSLGDMCMVLGTETTESCLLPLFVQLSRDESWEVRLSCAEVSIAVSCACTLATRKTVLAAVFTDLLMDAKPCVRMTAFGFLGAFICTFADPSVTKLDYDENGELIFVGQDGYEFRMPSVQFNYSRDMELMDNMRDVDSFPCESKIVDQSLNISNALRFIVENDSEHFSLPGLNPNPRLIKIYEQPLPEMSWTSHDTDGNPATMTMTETEEADESFNTFRFWRTPLPPLDSLDLEPEQDEIRANLNILDNELSSLSEKLAECSAGELEEMKTESVISSSSSPDSGWNSAEATPHVESVLPPGPKMEDGLHCTDAGAESSPETPETNLPNQEIVPQLLLDYFVSMTVPLKAEMMDKEIAQGCAYSLPAVALTLGPSNWPYIKNAYKCLSMNIKWRVRRTVVSSIHKLASILGEEIASKDLAPIFEGFIRDLDEVKIGALEHLADFLKLVKPETRNSFLPRLKEFLETEFDWNWRYRKEFGEQLRLLINLFSPADWLEHFEPLTTLLLCDKVAAVRHKAVLLFLDLLTNLSGEPDLQEKLLFILLEKFGEHVAWRRRQVFVLVCSEIAKQKALDNEDFCNILLDQLLLLSNEPVANICLAVARCLSVDVISTGYINPSSPHYSAIIGTLEKLKTHSDSDVRYFASLHEEFKEVNNDSTPPPQQQDLNVGT